MSEFAQQIIRWTAYAALIGMVVGAAGLLGQVVAVVLGGKESPLLLTTLGGLMTFSIGTLAGLAALVSARDGKR